MPFSASYEANSGNHRVACRFMTQMSVGVRRTGSTPVPGTVTDLSITGFRIQSQERLPKGTTLWVKLGKLVPVVARVVWVDQLIAGCAFEAPLHPSVLDQLLRTA